MTGDVVEVAEGDLANLKGTVLSIDGNKITIMPKHEDLKVCTCRSSTCFSFLNVQQCFEFVFVSELKDLGKSCQ